MLGHERRLLLGGVLAVRVDHETRRRTAGYGDDSPVYDVGGAGAMLGLTIGIRP